jgi:hypothetical protein
MPDVIREGFALLLLAAPQIPGIGGMHLCRLEVTGENIL